MTQKSITIYGIKNCDSIKKTRTWFEDKQLDYRFHDYRIDGLENPLIKAFTEKLDIDSILNRRSTSWRQLSDDQKADLNTEKVLQLMLENPTLIKRPIVSIDGQLIVGFQPDQYSAML